MEEICPAPSLILQLGVHYGSTLLFGRWSGPYSPPCPAGFLLGLGEAALHRFVVPIIAASMGQTGTHKLLVQHHVAIPDKCQKAVVTVFAFEAEGEPDTV